MPKVYRDTLTVICKLEVVGFKTSTPVHVIGTLLYQMGKVEEAEKYLRHALQLNPHHSGAVNNLKVVEYHKRKTKKRKRT